jgi:hypothetical protein
MNLHLAPALALSELWTITAQVRRSGSLKAPALYPNADPTARWSGSRFPTILITLKSVGLSRHEEGFHPFNVFIITTSKSSKSAASFIASRPSFDGCDDRRLVACRCHPTNGLPLQIALSAQERLLSNDATEPQPAKGFDHLAELGSGNESNILALEFDRFLFDHRDHGNHR